MMGGTCTNAGPSAARAARCAVASLWMTVLGVGIVVSRVRRKNKSAPNLGYPAGAKALPPFEGVDSVA
jgi:hypothetical protein